MKKLVAVILALALLGGMVALSLNTSDEEEFTAIGSVLQVRGKGGNC